MMARLSDSEPDSPREVVFPTLPIVTPGPAPRSEREKYGGLFTLGVAGLFVLALLLAWFAYGVWETRNVWRNIYVLHDARRPEAERIEAAYALSHDSRVNQRQRWDICLRKSLPPLARYVVAEGLTADAVADDPRGYALSVARSEGWPDWLRVILARPLAYASGRGSPVSREPLVELSKNADPAVSFWARFALAASADGDREAGASLENESHREGPYRELAQLLFHALKVRYDERTAALDRATLWLRDHHPDCARLWANWEVRAGRLVPRSAP
jgi:hypothetical protein